MNALFGEHRQLVADVEFLERFGFNPEVLQEAERRSQEFGLSASRILMAQGIIREQDYYASLAIDLRLPFSSNPTLTNGRGMTLDSATGYATMARAIADSVSGRVFLSPEGYEIAALRRGLNAHPKWRSQIVIVPYSCNRALLEKTNTAMLTRYAISGLRRRFPQQSAERVITASQAIVLTLFFQLAIYLSIFAPSALSLAAQLTATLFYLSCVCLRLFAAGEFRASRFDPTHRSARVPDHELPLYTVLIALYREAGQVDDLVDALLKLDWPLERLEIKLICEADDEDTVSAVRKALSIAGRHHIDLVTVPPSTPRTKPKALNYALPLCSGTLLVLYDAEDRPHPSQLREAHAAFANGAPDLACLQAPLVIYNHRESIWSRLFTIEYSGLFDGLLPYLARRNAPFPLGGTSNHFKRAVLDKVTGWDPFNVTEDADLGIRLSRAGYKTDTLRHATYEEAPVEFSIWLRQRTRWFKGWMQTFLVHMRNPYALLKDLGFGGAIMFHIMVTGMIVSALVHPYLLYLVGSAFWHAARDGAQAVLLNPIFIVEFFTLFLGYLAFAALAWRTLPVRGLQSLRGALWATPLYWLALSIAAWRAVFHLIIKPHEWEKTPHRLQQRKIDD